MSGSAPDTSPSAQPHRDNFSAPRGEAAPETAAGHTGHRPADADPADGLDDHAEDERRWSLTRNDTCPVPSRPATRRPRSAPVSRVVIEYAAVGGEDAKALEERQAGAIREVLMHLQARRAARSAGTAESSSGS